MLYKKLVILLVSMVFSGIVLSGCQQQVNPIAITNNASQTSDGGHTRIQVTENRDKFDEVKQLIASFQNQKTVNDPWNMVYSKPEKVYFFVRPASEENYYLATDKLFQFFINSLNWVSEYVPDKKDSPNSSEYDYIFKTNYSYDIYYNSKTNVFYFENDKKFYKAWGEKTNFWDSLRFNENNSTVDFNEDTLVADTQPIREDINGDRVLENIYLRTITKITDTGYSPSLYVVINGNSQLVFEDAFEGVRTIPEIHLLNSLDRKKKAVIVNSAIKPADWSPLQDYYVFQYKDGNIKTVPVIIPEQKFTVKGKEVKVIYPRYNTQKSFTVNDNTIRFYGNPKDIFAQGKNPLYLRDISFENGKDGRDRFVTFENAELHKGGYYYTVETWYRFKDDKLVPELVRFTDRR